MWFFVLQFLCANYFSWSPNKHFLEEKFHANSPFFLTSWVVVRFVSVVLLPSVPIHHVWDLNALQPKKKTVKKSREIQVAKRKQANKKHYETDKSVAKGVSVKKHKLNIFKISPSSLITIESVHFWCNPNCAYV